MAPLTLPVSPLALTGETPYVPFNSKGTRGEGFKVFFPSPLTGEGWGEGEDLVFFKLRQY